MNKKLKIFIGLTTIMIIIFQQIYCYATTDILGDLSQYDPSTSRQEETELQDRARIIITVIRRIGIIVSVISLMLIGIKTITGSAEEKSEYKERIPGYLLGVVLVVAITLLPTIIYEMSTGL